MGQEGHVWTRASARPSCPQPGAGWLGCCLAWRCWAWRCPATRPPAPIPTPSPSSSGTLSDRRLKTDIRYLRTTADGIRLYAFRYRGADPTTYVGVMAQDLLGTEYAAAVILGTDGYYGVDYARLGLRMLTWDEWSSAPVR